MFCFFSHYYAKIKVGSYDSLLIEKILTLHYVKILIKSVLNKVQNHYDDYISQKNVRINQLKSNDKNVFDSIIMLRFGEAKVAKEKFYGAIKPIMLILMLKIMLMLIIQLSQKYLKQKPILIT